MYYENPRPVYPNELYHYGIMGMHWGIRRYQPYRKGEKAKGGEKVKSGHFIGQAIAKNRTTRDSYLSSFLASDYQRKADKLHEEADRRKEKYEEVRNPDGSKASSNSKFIRRKKRYLKAKALADDNQARADFWEKQAKEDIQIANKVNEQFAHDHPHTIRKAPAKSVQSGANRWLREHTYANPKTGTASAAVAPIWNWNRGWGHQWAVEKTKGFNYRENRDTYKNYHKPDLKDTKKAMDLEDKHQKVQNKLKSGNSMSAEKRKKLEDKRTELHNKLYDLDRRMADRAQEYEPTMKAVRSDYKNYMNRTKQANENVGYSPKMRDIINRHRAEYNRIRNSGFDININSGEITVSNGSKARKAYYKEALKAGVPSDVAKGIAKRVTNQQLLSLASDPDRTRSALKDLARKAKNSTY